MVKNVVGAATRSISKRMTLTMNPIAQTSFEDFLAGRMAAHDIMGKPSALLGLLAELGVDVQKIKAATQ
jgi:hypothetical protein